MPVPRAPAPSIFGQHPSSHQAYFAGPAAAPPGTSYPAYGAAPPAYYAPPTAAGYTAAAPPSEGHPPQVPPPWDPALLAALHSAPSPSHYGGGGDWHMDTGATAHMTYHPGNLTSSTPVQTSTRITVGDGSSLPITHVGHRSFPSTSTPITMSNVLVSPNLV